MDWTNKHFNQAAIFQASRERVLEAARAALAESFGAIEDTAEGFVARGYGAWHPETALVRITPTPGGTQVAVELLVRRAAMRGYMLFDIGGYYNGQIDRWFTRISQSLGDAQDPALISKTASNSRFRRGCLAGCIVYVIVAACLGLLAVPLSRALLPQLSGSVPAPLSGMASGIGLLAGAGTFLYLMYPDAPASRFVRERLQRREGKKRS